MIKIGFANERKAKRDYVHLILVDLVDRLKILKTSLIHISVKPNSNDPELRSFKAVTEKIINYFQPRNQKIPSGDFNKGNYDATVLGYVAANAVQLSVIHFSGLIKLIDRLLENNERLLRALLICSAEKLYRFNYLLMGHYCATSDADKFVLGLGCDWGVHTEITTAIKTFFHGERQVVHCPYCNINRAFYSTLPNGDVSSSFSLDHFYNKNNYPLLTFCMFNLVPVDDICNGPNVKGEIQFYYDYHLNPYESGIDRTRMIFRPKIPNLGEDPNEIELKLIPLPSDRKYQQLVGNFPDIDETREHGNINVFNLKQNYNEDFVLERAGGVQRKCEALFRSRHSLRDFKKRMNGKELDINAYERFYKDEFGTEFLPKNFHRYCYSKLVRDIHDNVLERDKSTNNIDIKRFVSDHPA